MSNNTQVITVLWVVCFYMLSAKPTRFTHSDTRCHLFQFKQVESSWYMFGLSKQINTDQSITSVVNEKFNTYAKEWVLMSFLNKLLISTNQRNTAKYQKLWFYIVLLNRNSGRNDKLDKKNKGNIFAFYISHQFTIGIHQMTSFQSQMISSHPSQTWSFCFHSNQLIAKIMIYQSCHCRLIKWMHIICIKPLQTPLSFSLFPILSLFSKLISCSLAT